MKITNQLVLSVSACLLFLLVSPSTLAQYDFGVTDNGPSDMNGMLGVVDFDLSGSDFTLEGSFIDDTAARTITLTNFVLELDSSASTDRRFTLQFQGDTISVNLGDRTTSSLSGFAVDADGDGVIGLASVDHATFAINIGAAPSISSASVANTAVAPGGQIAFSDGPHVSTTASPFTATNANISFASSFTLSPGDRIELPNSIVGSAVPEPSALALFALTGLMLTRRRSRAG